MNKEELETYIQNSKKKIENTPQMDEANTETKLIEPLIELLGWDTRGLEVKKRYPVRRGSSKNKVDYALIAEESPVVFVEVKNLRTDLSEGHVGQLGSYMKQEDVEFGLLSNGEDFKILKMKWEEKGSHPEVLGEFSLEGMSNRTKLLSVLSKEKIKSEESEAIARSIEESRKAMEKLRENKNKMAKEITKIIEEEIGKYNPDKIKNESAKFIEELISQMGKPAKERIESEEKKIPKISREQLREYNDGKVVVCPSKPDGVNFLLENRAWGFINISGTPRYIAIYVSDSTKEIEYLAKVKEVVDPRNRESIVPDYKDYEHYEPGKKLVVLEKDSLRRLESPIPKGDKVTLRSLRYSKLENFISAKTLDDLF